MEDELMTMVYHDLMTYPIFPSVREYGEQSLENWYGSSGKDSTPFFDFVYNSFSGKRTSLGQGGGDAARLASRYDRVDRR